MGASEAKADAVSNTKAYANAYTAGQIDAACGYLTDAAKTNIVNFLAPKFPTGGVKSGNPTVDCKTFLTLAQAGMTSIHKTRIKDAIAKVTFTVTNVSTTEKKLQASNVDPVPIKITAKTVSSAWKLDSGFQGITQGSPEPALAPLPAGYACFGNALCKFLTVPDPDGGGDPLDPCKLLTVATKDCPLNKLCADPKYAIKNLNLTKLTDDIDGDGLSNGLEQKLIEKAGKTLKLNVCEKDSDKDGIPDLYDLVQLPGAGKGKGIQVELAVVEIRQDDHADGTMMDDGPFNGHGDPWIADAIFTTGPLSGTGTKQIQFDGLTFKNHPDDPEKTIKKRFKLSGGPFSISEDVRKYAKDVPTRFFKKKKGIGDSSPVPVIDPKNPLNVPKSGPTSLPMVGLSAVFLDWDDGCDNEVYAFNEPELEACGPKKGLVPKFSSISLAMELFGATDTIADIANSAAKTVSEPLCVPGYGITVCFEVRVKNADGGALDVCSLGLASTGWQNFIKKVPILNELPANVSKACNLK